MLTSAQVQRFPKRTSPIVPTTTLAVVALHLQAVSSKGKSSTRQVAPNMTSIFRQARLMRTLLADFLWHLPVPAVLYLLQHRFADIAISWHCEVAIILYYPCNTSVISYLYFCSVNREQTISSLTQKYEQRKSRKNHQDLQLGEIHRLCVVPHNYRHWTI